MSYVYVCVCVTEIWPKLSGSSELIFFFLLREQGYLEVADYLKGLNDFLENFGFFPISLSPVATLSVKTITYFENASIINYSALKDPWELFLHAYILNCVYHTSCIVFHPT